MKKNNATVTIESITPKTAKMFLETKHEHQRNIRETWVNQLAQEIVTGNWKLTSDCICIVDGYLANGQHRLSAVVKSNRQCDFIVMRTDDNTVFSVIDSGIKRTSSDVLKEYGCSNTSDIATISKIVLDYELGVMTRAGSNRDHSPTRTQIVEFAKQNSNEIMEILNFVSPLYREARILPRTMASAFLLLAYKNANNKKIAESFVIKVYGGGNGDDAASILHKRLLNAKLGLRLHPSYVFALMIKAFTSVINGTSLGSLRISEGESFPKMPQQTVINNS